MKNQLRLAATFVGLSLLLALVLVWNKRASVVTQKLQWNLKGQTLVYELKYQNQGEMLISPLGTLNPGQDAPKIPFHVTMASAQLTVYAAPKNEGQLILQLSAAPIDLQLGSITDAEKIAIEAALQKPFAVQLTSQGVPEEFRFDQDAPLLARNILRQISGAFFPILEEGTLERINFSGHEAWQVQRLALGADVELKEELRSLGLKDASAFQVSGVGQSLAIWKQPMGWMHSIQHKKSIALRKDKAEAGREQLELHAKFLKQSAHELTADTSTWRSFPAHTMEGYQDAAEALLRQKVAGKDFNLELNALLQASHSSLAQQKEHYAILLAFLKLDRSHLATIRDLIRELDPREMPFDVLATLLARSGWPEAQKMLLDLARELATNPDVSGQLLFNLGLLEHPDRGVVMELKQWMDSLDPKDPLFNPIASQAASAAYNLGDARVQSEMAATLTKAWQDPESRRAAVIALGNLGAEDTVKEAHTLLLSANPDDRLDAVAMLRRIGGEKRNTVNQQLIRASSDDQDVDVRRQASAILKFRQLDAPEVQSLARSLGQEKDLRVAQELLHGVGAQSIRDKDQVRQVLLSYIETCGTPKLCEAARSQLLSM